MKNLVLITGLLLLGQIASATTATITCDRAVDAPRADSIQKIQYKINLDNRTAELGCTEKIDNNFCGSIRMDLSKPLAPRTTDCRNQNAEMIYRFYLVQEDEFENQVQIQVTRSCATGKITIPAQLKATILNYQSGELESGVAPFTKDEVDCSTK